jgi:hypothetical protein
MAQDDVINLDPYIVQLLQQASQNTAATQNVPTATPQTNIVQPSSTNPQLTNIPGLLQQDSFPEGQPVTVGDSIRSLVTGYEPSPTEMIIRPGAAIAEAYSQDPSLMERLPPSPEVVAASEAGILNEGAPIGSRFGLSLSSVYNDERMLEITDSILKKRFIEDGLITDDYNLGLRIGPQSQRLEFRDPRFGGKYNVVDPFGAGDLFAGDIVDISMDTVLPIATETAAALLAAKGGPMASIGAASGAAFVTSLGRLKAAQLLGYLPEDMPESELYGQAFKESGISLAAGLGGNVLFKVVAPIARKVGLANPKLPIDIDEKTFIKAYDDFLLTPEGKKLQETGITPSAAQIVEFMSKQEGVDTLSKAQRQIQAEQLSREEELVAMSPEAGVGEAVIMPSKVATTKAEELIETTAKTDMPAGVSRISPAPTEAEALRLGTGIQRTLQETFEQNKALATQTSNNAIDSLDSQINELVNLPPSIRSRGDIGGAAVKAVKENYDKGSQAFDKRYTSVWEQWAESTGKSLDTPVVKPTEAVALATSLRKELADRAFASTDDMAVINKVLNTFAGEGKGAAVPVKQISVNTLNDNIKDLRRLERRAYLASQRGETAPSPETISAMVDALEAVRNRLVSGKNLPKGLADELKLVDDDFAVWATKYRNASQSAVAKIRNSNPEAAFKMLIQPDDQGGTLVRELSEELSAPQNADIRAGLRTSLIDMWKSDVVTVKNGKMTFNLAKHNDFLKKYGVALDAYLGPAEKSVLGSASKFSEAIAQNEAKRNTAIRTLEQNLDLAGGTLRKPEFIFRETWEPGGLSAFQQTDVALRMDPSLREQYKAFVFKDMFSGDRMQTVNGREVLNPDGIRKYLDDHGSKLKELMGEQYVADLRTVVDAAEVALTQVPKRKMLDPGQTFLTNAVRAYVGLFTRPGRILTAFNRQRGRMKVDALSKALADPSYLRRLAESQRKRPLTAEAERLVGKLFFDRYGEPLEEQLNVPEGQAAQILQQLEERSLGAQ